MEDSQERLRIAVEALQAERRQTLAEPTLKPTVRPRDANRLVAYIVGGMIALVFGGLAFYALAHRVGVGWAIIIVTLPGWAYGLYRGVDVLAILYRARRELAAVRAAEFRRRQQEAVQRAAATHRNRLVRELKSLAGPRLMVTLNSGDFERFVLQYFALVGYETEETGCSGDGGVDGILRQAGHISLVQCKRYLNAVGEPEIRDFLGAVTKRGAERGFFVTTSSFNQNAIAFAEGTRVTLIDGATLADMIRQLQCIDPQTGQAVELPLFNSDHWHEFSFVRREKREPVQARQIS